jgi:hypothetical protein
MLLKPSGYDQSWLASIYGLSTPLIVRQIARRFSQEQVPYNDMGSYPHLETGILGVDIGPHIAGIVVLTNCLTCLILADSLYRVVGM